MIGSRMKFFYSVDFAMLIFVVKIIDESACICQTFFAPERTLVYVGVAAIGRMTRTGKERVRTGAGTGIVGRGRCVISA